MDLDSEAHLVPHGLGESFEPFRSVKSINIVDPRERLSWIALELPNHPPLPIAITSGRDFLPGVGYQSLRTIQGSTPFPPRTLRHSTPWHEYYTIREETRTSYRNSNADEKIQVPCFTQDALELLRQLQMFVRFPEMGAEINGIPWEYGLSEDARSCWFLFYQDPKLTYVTQVEELAAERTRPRHPRKPMLLAATLANIPGENPLTESEQSRGVAIVPSRYYLPNLRVSFRLSAT